MLLASGQWSADCQHGMGKAWIGLGYWIWFEACMHTERERSRDATWRHVRTRDSAITYIRGNDGRQGVLGVSICRLACIAASAYCFERPLEE